jgi:SPP1 gp7 family putative phage head morphogenesis protein
MPSLRNPLLYDPSRTSGLRRAFAKEFLRRIESIRREMMYLVLKEDALALKDEDNLMFNFNPYHDELGRFTFEVGQYFDDAPNDKATSKEAKKWRKDMQEVYDTNQEFKTVADAVTIYTQGSYQVFSRESGWAVGKEVDPSYKQQGGLDFSGKRLGAATSPLGEYKNYFKGQDVTKADYATVREAGAALHNAISSSKPLEHSVYRGFALHPSAERVAYKAPNVGETIDLAGVTSFSSDREVSRQFATGSAKGQQQGGLSVSGLAITYEIVPGAKGLKVGALSPWDQKEVISAGKFKVTDVIKGSIEAKHGKWTARVEHIHIKMEQYETYTAPKQDKSMVKNISQKDIALVFYQDPFLEYEKRDDKEDNFIRNTRWKWRTPAQKVAAFKEWLEEQTAKKLLSKEEVGQLWTERYLKAAYERGKVRGTTQASKARKAQYQAFLTDTSRARRKMESLVQRNLDELEGFSKRMSTKAARLVADAVDNNQTPAALARRLTREFNIEKKRAITIARTEIVRAQAEGQLDAFDDLGITHVKVMAEFRIANDQACPICQELNGTLFTIEEAHGVIPVHPNCQCGWEIVLQDQEEDLDLKRNRKRVRKALKRARR